MRNWVWGGCLVAVASAGVYFVFSGAGRPSHCGPCIDCPRAEPTPPGEPPTVPVVEVVDVDAALTPPKEPAKLPFVSFDEPPLAKPPMSSAAAPPPDVIQAAFTEPAPQVEVAPPPRRVGPLRLATPDDPF